MDNQFDLSNRFYKLVLVLIIGVLVFFVAQIFYQNKLADQQSNYQFSVSGEGKVFAKPDIAIVSFGAQTEGNTTNDVITQNTQKMNAVLKAVKDLGVAEKDIQTTNYSLSPLYNYTEGAGRQFQGYTLSQEIQVKIRDFSKTGDILQRAVGAGANLTGNLQFTIENSETVKNEARAKAIEQAKDKAKSIAKESGIKLGKLINVSENYNNYPVPLYENAMGLGKGFDSSPAPVIQPGQQEIQVTVNLTYQVK